MQTQLENISVAGMNVALAELHRKEMKGAIVDDIARFGFYRAAMAGNEFVQIFITDSNKLRLSSLVDGLTDDRAFFETVGGVFTRTE